MPRSINKYKLYLYLFFFIFLSSVFNFQFVKNYQDKFGIKNINIYGLSYDEKKLVQNELSNFQNENIFKLNKEKVLAKLNKLDFIENVYINKIMPSSINVELSKTLILGKTLKNGELFYIGKNGKFINSSQFINKIDTPNVFGEFNIEEYFYLLDVLEMQNLAKEEIKNYYYFKNKRWDLSFSNGKILKLPSKNIEDSIIIYKKLLKNNNLANTKIIDLRVSNQVILTKIDE